VARGHQPRRHHRRRGAGAPVNGDPAVNANDATLTALTTAQAGSRVADTAPNALANPGFDLILGAVAGSALGSHGAQIVSIRHSHPFVLVGPARAPGTQARSAWPAGLSLVRGWQARGRCRGGRRPAGRWRGHVRPARSCRRRRSARRHAARSGTARTC